MDWKHSIIQNGYLNLWPTGEEAQRAVRDIRVYLWIVFYQLHLSDINRFLFQGASRLRGRYYLSFFLLAIPAYVVFQAEERNVKASEKTDRRGSVIDCSRLKRPYLCHVSSPDLDEKLAMLTNDRYELHTSPLQSSEVSSRKYTVRCAYAPACLAISSAN